MAIPASLADSSEAGKKPPWRKLRRRFRRVRAAMTLAVDRDYIVNVELQAGQTSAYNFVAPGIQDSEGKDFSSAASAPGAICETLQAMYPGADLTTCEGQCKLARTLYDQAVLEGAWDPNTPLVYYTSSSNAHNAIASCCITDWHKVLDLNVTLETTDWSSFMNILCNDTWHSSKKTAHM